MAQSIVPSEREVRELKNISASLDNLIQHAEEGDRADRSLTIREALKQYKTAVFWAMFLSTGLIMEGYDLVIVSAPCDCAAGCCRPSVNTRMIRSLLSMVKNNSRTALEYPTRRNQGPS